MGRRSNPVERASRYLADCGWIQGQLVSAETGAACLLGALVISTPGPSVEQDAAFDAITEVLVRRCPDAPITIQEFNDDPATTWEDIRSVLEEASRAYEEVYACQV